MPIAFLDVLGQPVWQRVLCRLQRFGVSRTTLISDTPENAEHYQRHVLSTCGVPHVQAEGEAFWKTAEATFQEYSRSGADLVMVIRIGPYVGSGLRSS